MSADGLRIVRMEEVPPDSTRLESSGAPLSGSAESWDGARTLLALKNGRPAARLAYELARDLHSGGAPCGILGAYAALDPDAGTALLREACRKLAGEGAARVVGPMDGSTWDSYRLPLPGPDLPPEPPFFAEPRAPAAYHEQFRAAGFRAAELFQSRIVLNPGLERAARRALDERVARAGFTVRPLDPARPEEELRILFALCEAAFSGNRYYRPVGFAGFRARYRPLLPLLDPELVRLAFDRNGVLTSLAFAFPDPLSAVNGRPTRAVLKTIASLPGMRRLGLSAHLADQVHELAFRKGYTAVIHALMHDSNASVRISERYDSRIFRRYALYEWNP